MRRAAARVLLGLTFVTTAAVAPAAAERLCDPAYEDCRAPLINLIRSETSGIDVAFWFMQDPWYATEIIKRFQAGVPVRVLVDPRASQYYAGNAQILTDLATAGIPMRKRTASGILHWKMMLFAGQRTVEFSGANFSPEAFGYSAPYSNYIDEAIYFSDDLSVVQSFMRRYDDLWTDTSSYANYANVSGSLRRRYATYAISPEMNFPPLQDYRARARSEYNAEPAGIDVTMYRITDRAHSDAMIAAVGRGVRVRLITEQEEYRNRDRLWDAWNVDRMFMAGVQIRQRGHLGLNHQKSVILRGQGTVIFGSSNWSSPSANSQEEHNYFTTKGWIVSWFENQFERKWNNLGPSAETQPFRPLPPDTAAIVAPANGATGVPTTPVLTFDAGPFAHLYDIYLGTSPDPPLFAAGLALGPTESSSAPRTYQLPLLAPGTTYYWRVVAKTMALQASVSPVWSFTTSGTAPRPLMFIDVPTDGLVLQQPFYISGWAIDLAATRGTGIDAVHVYAYPYPGSGTAPVFLGTAQLGISRPDVGAVYGSAFTPSGYRLQVRGLRPGDYMLVAYARSTVSGTFVVARGANVRIVSSAVLMLGTPANGSAVAQPFAVSGWTLDTGASSGGGVDVVHVYAYPLDTGAAPIFLGLTSVNVYRPDVAAIFGSQFSKTGFNMVAGGLPRGRFRIVAFGHSVVSNTFSAVGFVDVTMQ
jgi:hypothetical protein